jgi:hypothetical protein
VSGKINIFSWLGVDLVRSPLHIPDGAFTQAQNAEFPDDQGEGGIKKRGGLTRLNSSALAGSVQAAANIPFPSAMFGEVSVPEQLFLGIDFGTGSNPWEKSTDGSTFITLAAVASRGIAWDDTAAGGRTLRLATRFRRSAYFLSDGLTTPHAVVAPFTLVSWDGIAESVVLTIPSVNSVNPFRVLDLITADDVIYLAVLYQLTPNTVIVYRFDPATSLLEQVGDRIAGVGVEATTAAGLAVAFGSLFIGLTNDVGAVISMRAYRINPVTETTWTLDNTFASGDGHRFGCVAVYRGLLYMASRVTSGANTPDVYVRSSAGVWTVSRNGATTTGGWLGMAVFNDTLFALWVDSVASGGATTWQAYLFDGTTWSVDEDLKATLGLGNATADFPVSAVTFKSALYWVIGVGAASVGSANLIKRTAGGVWTSVGNGGCLGPLAVVGVVGV